MDIFRGSTRANRTTRQIRERIKVSVLRTVTRTKEQNSYKEMIKVNKLLLFNSGAVVMRLT